MTISSYCIGYGKSKNSISCKGILHSERLNVKSVTVISVLFFQVLKITQCMELGFQPRSLALTETSLNLIVT